jgi:hypothetical protein
MFFNLGSQDALAVCQASVLIIAHVALLAQMKLKLEPLLGQMSDG